VKCASSTVAALLLLAGCGDQHGPVPVHGLIAFHSGFEDTIWHIYVMKSDGSAVRRLTNPDPYNPVNDHDPSWSPDGRRVAFARAGGTVGVVRVEPGSRLKQFGVPVIAVSDLSWSPDGRRLVFTADLGNDRSAVYVMRSDGTGRRKLAIGASRSWSPDGRRIVFQGTQGGRASIYVLDLADHRRPRLLSFGLDARWSPTDARIVYASKHRRHIEILVTNGSGTGRRQVARVRTQDVGDVGAQPTWSPDGRKIAFLGRADRLKVVNADGSGERWLMRRASEAAIFDFAWSPDGREIAFTGWTDARGGGIGVTSNVYVVNIADGTERRLTDDGDSWSPVWQPATERG
jgi:TolB protein